MNLNYLKNLIIDNVEQNTQKVGIVSAIIILYFNPALYFTIISVGATVGLYQNFTYDLNFDFKMRKNLIEDKNEVGTNTEDTVQTDTEIEPEYDMTKSVLFE